MARPVKPPLPPHEHDAEYAAISHAHDWTEIADKPATFDPTPHVHPVADIDATGTADGTTYLRGDGTWETPDGGAVDSVNAQTGAVVLDADDIDDTTATHKYVTAADLTKLSNLSGVNTGDQDLSGYALTSSLAGVALSGAYADLTGKPTIPTTLVQLDTTVTGAQLNALKTKVDGIASGATANSSDATLLNRANHTGTQTASTISNFQSTVSANTDVAANTSARHTHANAAVLNATTASYTTALNTKLSGIATGATANATDAQLRDRATHTGAQAISTVTGLQTALDGKAATSHTHATADVTGLDTALSGKASTSHTHGVSDLTATGTRNSTTILYGDNTWKTAPSGGGGVTDHTALTNIGTNTHAQIDTHIASTSNPHSVTKAQVGLSNVDNTSDASKPISTATQTALDGKANTSHTHVATTDLTATGTKSSATYLRGDNTWNTPTNTTYTEITEAEITTGTASTLRTISGRRAQFIVTKAQTGMATSGHNHDAVYAPIVHTHAEYASATHNHDADYADITHTHVYADITDAPAPLALAGDGVATTAARSDHTHDGTANNTTQVGDGADASGNQSMSIGHGSEAGAESAHALGINAYATKTYTTAVGMEAGATQPNAIALGASSWAGADWAIVIGAGAWNSVANTAMIKTDKFRLEPITADGPTPIEMRRADGTVKTITIDNNDALLVDGVAPSAPSTLTGSINLEMHGTLKTGDTVVARMPFAGTFTGWDIYSKQTGSISLMVAKGAHADYPVVTDEVSGTEKPTISANNKNSSTALIGWTPSFSLGDVVQLSIESVSAIEDVYVSLRYTRSI